MEQLSRPRKPDPVLSVVPKTVSGMKEEEQQRIPPWLPTTVLKWPLSSTPPEPSPMPITSCVWLLLMPGVQFPSPHITAIPPFLLSRTGQISTAIQRKILQHPVLVVSSPAPVHTTVAIWK